jgi:hypothetical protein
MRTKASVILIALAALSVGCQISPTVTPDEGRRSSRYDDCRNAARAYCRDSVQAPEGEMSECVAKAAFTCTSGGGS